MVEAFLKQNPLPMMSYGVSQLHIQPLIASQQVLNMTFLADWKKTTLPQGFSIVNSLNWDISGNNVWYFLTDFEGGKPDSKIWYDKLGRETKVQTAGFNGQWLTRLVAYNAKGQVYTKTNDYYTSESPLTTTNTYDVYGRTISMANVLNTITNTYTSLSNGKVQVATANSSGQTSIKISDASGMPSQ